jgi:hypothetical protein
MPQNKQFSNSFKNYDLGANLGDIMKPSMPDFGYEEVIVYDEEKSKKPKGWGHFLDVINR